MTRKNRGLTLIIVSIVIVIAAAAFARYYYASDESLNPTPIPSVSASPSPETLALTLAGGEVALSYSGDTYGLAASPGQVSVNSYIPPCDPDFDYCFYYNTTQYQGTNFESAGLRIKKRADIGNEKSCLNTPPAGFSAQTTPARTLSRDSYSASVFDPVGDAGAGHMAEGSLYRLFVKKSSTCYEFETRIGTTQFANYPSGTIREFTATDRSALKASLKDILNHATLTSTGEVIAFP